MKLTIEKLKEMKPETVFATGIGTYPELINEEIRWVACRGIICDWTIYYHSSEKTVEWVQRRGDKCFTEAAIKKLVPCTDEAYEMYRW